MSTHAPVMHNLPVVNDHARMMSEQLASRIGSHRFEMWFGAATIDVAEDAVHVITDSQFVARWIDSHFTRELRDAAAHVLDRDARVVVRVAAHQSPTDTSSTVEGEADAENFQFPTDEPGQRAATNPGAALLVEPKSRVRSIPRRGLTLRRLEDFVVGASNKLAYSAACTICADQNSKLISPLFIHGECGVGKTHLLQGICKRMGDLHGYGNVRYVTGEQFTNEYIASVRNQTIDAFRERVRRLDLLAIDDVQFLSNKTRTQSEFQYTLDAIEHLGARIVLASNEHPRQIKKFSPGLINRLLSGMVVQVDPPNRETRLQLVHRIAAARDLVIADAAAELIATRCVGSVRELEGAITKLAAMKLLSSAQGDASTQREVGLLLVEQLFNEQAWRPAAPVRISAIIDAVCARFGVNRGDIVSSGRHRRVVIARAAIAFLGREMTTLSYPEIAQAMGRRHHSTVHTAAQRLARQVDNGEYISLNSHEAAVALADMLDQLRHEINRS